MLLQNRGFYYETCCNVHQNQNYNKDKNVQNCVSLSLFSSILLVYSLG